MSSTPNPHIALADAAEQRACEGFTLRYSASECVRIIENQNTVLDTPLFCACEYLRSFIALRADVPALAAAVRDQAATIAALQTKLTEALALVEAGYREAEATFCEVPRLGAFEVSETFAKIQKLKA